jgi:hypothetical protein
MNSLARTVLFLIPPIIIPVFLALPLSAQTPAQTFTKAKLMEVNEGDIKGALALYRKVAGDPSSADALKARALYRQGLCLIKLADYAGARGVFERLVKDYARTDPGVQAKLMLRSLGASEKGMTAPRDLSYEVKDLLIKGTTKGETKTVLKTLLFYGDAAKPALHEALQYQDRSVYLLALNALAQMGDLTLLDRLLAAAGDKGVRTRYHPIYLSEQKALESLCKAHKAAVPRVAAAYRELPAGRAKANLMRVLLDLKRYDKIDDFKDYLQSDNDEMRDAAWDVYSRKVLYAGGSAEAFLEDLLQVWKAHPEWRVELSEQLFYTGRMAVRNKPSLARRWDETFLAAARSKNPAIVKKVVGGLKRFEFGYQFRARAALLASPDESVRERAADISRNVNRGVKGIDTAALHDFVSAVLQAAKTHRDRNEQHASRLLRELGRNAVPLLDPVAYAALIERLLSEPLKSVFYTETRLGHQDATSSQLVKFFKAGRIQGPYQQQDKNYTIAEKYLPVWLEWAGKKAPANIRLEAVESLGAVIEGGWKFLSDADRNRIKAVLFAGLEEIASGSLPTAVAGSLKMMIDRALASMAQQLPRVLTVEEVLANMTFGPPPGKSTYTPHERTVFQTFSPQDISRAFLAAVKMPKVPADSLMRLLNYTKLEPKARDAALRQLWPRADESSRRGIVSRLDRTPENLAFLNGIATQDMPLKLSKSVLFRLQGWESRDALPGLTALLASRHNDVKVRACLALESLADPRAVPALIELLSYHDTAVREAAEKALTAIRTIDKKKAEWKKWYEELKRQGGREKL